MARAKELPQLTSDFLDMSREYLKQETLGRARLLGRHAGLGLAAAAVTAVGVVMLAIAAVRGLIRLLPGDADHKIWSGVGYLVGAVVVILFGALIVLIGGRDDRKS